MDTLVGILDRSHSIVTVASLTETILYSFSIPANALASTYMAHMQVYGTITYTGAANNPPQFRAKFGGTTILDSGVIASGDFTLGGTLPWWMNIYIKNMNSTSSQRNVLAGFFPQSPIKGYTYNMHSTSAIVTTSARTLELTVQNPITSGGYSVSKHFGQVLLY